MPLQSSLDEETLKHIAGDGKIELCLYSKRSKTGMPAWELKIKMPDGRRKIFVVCDYGFEETTRNLLLTVLKPLGNAMRKFAGFTTNRA